MSNGAGAPVPKELALAMVIRLLSEELRGRGNNSKLLSSTSLQVLLSVLSKEDVPIDGFMVFMGEIKTEAGLSQTWGMNPQVVGAAKLLNDEILRAWENSNAQVVRIEEVRKALRILQGAPDGSAKPNEPPRPAAGPARRSPIRRSGPRPGGSSSPIAQHSDGTDPQRSNAPQRVDHGGNPGAGSAG